MSSPTLRVANLEKTYPPMRPGGPALELFRGLSLEVFPGEMVAIVGESGAGKSSLLHLLAALDAPTAGEVHVGGQRATGLDRAAAAHYRNHEIGYVWQAHYLLPEFTAQENVAMPLLARGTARRAAMAAAATWLERVGLGDRLDHRAGELSGGEQQRTSIARALITEPRLLLADEPTGNLDADTAERVFALLRALHQERSAAGEQDGTSASRQALASVLVTHSLDFAARCDRTLRLREGRLEPLR